MIKRALLLISALMLSACAGSIDGDKYLDAGAELDLFAFFDGDVKGWGIVQGRDGNVLQRFEVLIDGSVAGNTLTLDETFSYSLGEGPEKRIWTISRTGDGTYEGRADDILDTAKGRSFGNALNWEYRMDLDVDGSTYEVGFKDWMWAFDDNTVMNRSYIKKFGITWAEVTMFMERQ